MAFVKKAFALNLLDAALQFVQPLLHQVSSALLLINTQPKNDNCIWSEMYPLIKEIAESKVASLAITFSEISRKFSIRPLSCP
jgi:hypothetical protein